MEVPVSDRASWEILPQEAEPGEVIVSKRTALGVFSNLSAAAFQFEGQSYASLEGLWQMLKYPEENDLRDPRKRSRDWPYARSQVAGLSGFEAKRAGDKANEILKQLGIKWVSYKGRRFEYKDGADGSAFHYELILGATREKIRQNPELSALLRRTRGLKLRMDHRVGENDPPAYRTAEILMKIREEIR